MSFCLFSPRAPARGPLAGAALRAARLIFLRSSVSVIAFVFAMKVRVLLSLLKYFGSDPEWLPASEGLKPFELGKLLNQLLHAVLLKLYCNLRIIPIAFAAKDGSFAILGVTDANSLL